MAPTPATPIYTGRAAATERWRRRITAAVTLLTPVLVILIGVLLFNELGRAERLRLAESASQDRRTLVLGMLSAHADLETGQRGFLLTGDERFLEPYYTGAREIGVIHRELRQAYQGDREGLRQLDSIDDVSRRKRAFVDRTIAMRRSGGERAALDIVLVGTGKALMDDLRAKIARLQTVERARLSEARARAAQAAGQMRLVILSLVALLLVMLMAAIMAAVHLLRARTSALIQFEEVSRRQRAILDSAMDAIVTLNPSGSIETINATGARMFGFAEPELLRRDVGVLFATPPPIGAVAEQLRAMELAPGTPGRVQEIIGRRKDRSTFPTDVAITAMPLAEGQHYVAVIRDVSERQRIDRMKSEFVATVSHELRTPLTSIAGSLGLLAGGAAGELGEKAKRLIEIAKNNADRLVRLINDILDIEKIESGKMRFETTPLDLGDAIDSAVAANQGMAEKFGVLLVADRASSPAMTLADADRLAQVLTNLISNAIKFSPRGEKVVVALRPGGARHRVSVCDRGPGIPEDFRDRIFQKFAQADSSDTRQLGGTGLGLSIVREIVERLGGSIGFECPPAGGTKFHVDLPALAAGPGKILTAEPLLLCGEAIADLLHEPLTTSGHAVEVARTREQAEAALVRHSFAAIVIDLTIDGDSGVAIIKAARASAMNAKAPLLAVGVEPGGDAFAGDAALVVDWIAKPASAEDLSQAVVRAIAGANEGQPHVLHVDDDPDVLQVVAGALERRARLTSVTTLRDARAALQDTRFDLVILDLTLADGNGADLLMELNRGERAGPPVIIFSAEDAHRAAAGVVGAFLTKSRTPLAELVGWVERLAASRGQETA